jgi:phosphoglycolate phosphatase-like HAD superfamily hydrolase
MRSNAVRKHLIWDFDGTLYDSYPQITEAFLDALSSFGRAAEYDEVYALNKKTLFAAVTVYAERFSLPADALMAAFRQRHGAQGAFPVMPGLRECLEATAETGCRHYLFTHRDRLAVQQLESDGLAPFFTECVTREDGFADKPSPEAVLYLMDRHRFAARDALMIGDRDIDVGAGHAAGVAGVLLDPDGFYPRVEAEYRINRLDEIPALLKRMP